MIKLIVTDLDDTLLRTDKTISRYTRDVFRAARERGIKTAFATARGSSVRNFVAPELFDARILMNGSKAYMGDEPVYVRTLSRGIAAPYLRALDAAGIRAAAEIGGRHLANFNVREQWGYIGDFGLTDFSDLPDGIEKLYALPRDGHPEDLALIRRALPPELYLYISKDGLAMVTHSEATKAKALAALAVRLGIAPEEIAAFGDDANDIDMLTACGTGVAVKNALPEVMAAVLNVTDSNDCDGVARWIHSNLLGGICFD